MVRKYSPEETRARLLRWADRRERCHREVRNKLTEWGVPVAEREDLIAYLISTNALNEHRYALAFASDHFRFHHWGIQKITSALRMNGISEQNISLVRKSLDAGDVRKMIAEMALRKFLEIKQKDVRVRRQKVAQYLIRKGFETDSVWEVVGSLE